jgi:hypothetical protein
MPARLFALALLATILAVSACGKRGDPIRPLPRAGQQAEPLPTPPIPPGRTLEDATTPEGEEVF